MSFPPDLLEELNKVKLISIDDIIKSKINDPIETYRRELVDDFTKSGLMKSCHGKINNDDNIQARVGSFMRTLENNITQVKPRFDHISESHGKYLNSVFEIQAFIIKKLLTNFVKATNGLEEERIINAKLNSKNLLVTEFQEKILANMEKLEYDAENDELKSLFEAKSHVEALFDMKTIYLAKQNDMEIEMLYLQNMTSDIADNNENEILENLKPHYRSTTTEINAFEGTIELRMQSFVDKLSNCAELEIGYVYNSLLLQEKWHAFLQSLSGDYSLRLKIFTTFVSDFKNCVVEMKLVELSAILNSTRVQIQQYLDDSKDVDLKNKYLKSFEKDCNEFCTKLVYCTSWLQDIINMFMVQIDIFQSAVATGRDAKVAKLYSEIMKSEIKDPPKYNGTEFIDSIQLELNEIIKDYHYRIKLKFIKLCHDVLVKKLDTNVVSEFTMESQYIVREMSQITKYFS